MVCNVLPVFTANLEESLIEVPTKRHFAGSDITQEQRKIAATTAIPQHYPKKKGAQYRAPLGLLPD
jgi:hypothetical protein